MKIKQVIVNCECCNSNFSETVTKNFDYGFNTCENEFEFVKCSNCGIIYLKNRPETSEIYKIYPEKYDAHITNHNLIIKWIRYNNQLKKYKKLRRFINSDATIFEFGCGTGEYLISIATSNLHQGNLIGTDFSEVGKELLLKHGIMFTKPSLDNPELFGKIDALVMNQVIEHLEHPTIVLKQIYKLLKPGGILVIETPCTLGWDFNLFGVKYWGGWHTPRHFFIFNPENLIQLSKKLNLNFLELNFIMSPFLWAQSFKFFLRYNLGLKKISNFFNIKNLFFLIFIGLVELTQLIYKNKTSNYRIIFKKNDEAQF